MHSSHVCIVTVSGCLLVPLLLRWAFLQDFQPPHRSPFLQPAQGVMEKGKKSLSCPQWAVVSLEPGQAMPEAISHSLADWCLLVLGSSIPARSDVSAWSSVSYLDTGWYDQWCHYRLCQSMDWARDSQYRKNVGYLFALEHGATLVMDLDSRSSVVGSIPSLAEGWVPVTYPTGLVWNPYPAMTDLTTYPRGFPTSHMGREEEQLSQSWERVPAASLGVIQSLSRASQVTVDFPVVAVSLKTFAPFTDAATIFTEDALWALVLPKTRPGCSPDITRSYLAQKVLWRLGKNVAFSSPWASQPEDVADKDSQEFTFPLDRLIDLVIECQDVKTCMVQVYSNFSESTSCVTDTEVTMLNDWFSDLEDVGYSLPPMKTRKHFAFLTQGSMLTPTSHPRLRQADPEEPLDYDAYYLSFGTPSGDLFYPNSSWQGGRNALLRIALAKEIHPGYDYFVFMDEDVAVDPIDDNPAAFWKEDMGKNGWFRFQEFLLKFEPQIGVGKYVSHHVNESAPYDIITSYDPVMVAYRRTALEMGLPVWESYLDWMSSWNQEYLMRFFNRMFYSKSSFQCNSVMQRNTEVNYHIVDPDPSKYSYKQGVYWAQIETMLKEHFNPAIEPNPLEIYLQRMIEVENVNSPLSVFGQMEIDLDQFNITDRETFGFGLHTEMLNFFNVCGDLFKHQARWWKSNLSRHVWSDKIANVIKYMEENCEPIKNA